MKEKLPPGVDTLPKGIDINGNLLRIAFMYEGERRREPLRSVAKINKAAIAYADNKRRTILAEIRDGRFDYAAHFPESSWLKARIEEQVQPEKRTVAEGIKRWLEVQKVKRANSTFINYRSKSKHVKQKFGDRTISTVSKSDIELFQAELLSSGLSPKTVNDIFTIVRGVWADAFSDEIIKSDPMARIENIQSDADVEFADPFTRSEIDRIAEADPERTPDSRMIVFNCWAGLSLSELIALAVEDVDLEAGTIRIRRALVTGEFKVPKERSRIRTVELIHPALVLMKTIAREASRLAAEDITVTQRDNITRKHERVRFLFRSSTSGLLWSGKTVSNWFTAHLEKAGIRHRGANQARHTFASQALSSYVPIEWVARQLGHSDTTMVRKHYGRWISKDTKSMADIVSKMMGLSEPQP
ncbi:integrase [Pseudomonas sp. MF6396]|uniref:site-specific integrase n=1 Tax=Pseudomonas sp. MF6396 TaxID=1960828 RepID=UPI000997C1EA|nr:site-specific integrase [Pseudomonas sp. MF6396]OOV90957.1 integrase [Pseudomonas sp. MF6396]